MNAPPTQGGYALGIKLMKRVIATHKHYVDEELLQQLDEGQAGAASGGGGGASAHVKVDWDGPAELQGYGIIIYFVMGAATDGERQKRMGRSTKNYSATETQAYNSKTAKGLVRSVRITPTTPIPNSPTIR